MRFTVVCATAAVLIQGCSKTTVTTTPAPVVQNLEVVKTQSENVVNPVVDKEAAEKKAAEEQKEAAEKKAAEEQKAAELEAAKKAAEKAAELEAAKKAAEAEKRAVSAEIEPLEASRSWAIKKIVETSRKTKVANKEKYIEFAQKASELDSKIDLLEKRIMSDTEARASRQSRRRERYQALKSTVQAYEKQLAEDRVVRDIIPADDKKQLAAIEADIKNSKENIRTLSELLRKIKLEIAAL
jgi:hypothetical protein